MTNRSAPKKLSSGIGQIALNADPLLPTVSARMVPALVKKVGETRRLPDAFCERLVSLSQFCDRKQNGFSMMQELLSAWQQDQQGAGYPLRARRTRMKIQAGVYTQ
jgi:hypothetical protein